MKHRNKIVSIIATVMLLACFAAIPVMAQVPTPCAFSGSVTLDGAASPGSIITVELEDGTPVVTTPAVVTVTAGSEYGVVIPQDSGTGKPAQGATLNFYVDGFLGGTDTWAAGGIKTLNLVATSAPAVVEYDLTINSTVGGSVTTPGEGTFTYDTGTVVTLTATPSAGYQFSHWSGDAAGTSATTTVTMNADKAVTANFVVVTHTLTVTVSPTGTGSVAKSPNLAQYPWGTVVTLTATPSAGYKFSHWSGAATGTSATTTVTMNANKAVTANFVQIPPEEIFVNWLAAFIAALR